MIKTKKDILSALKWFTPRDTYVVLLTPEIECFSIDVDTNEPQRVDIGPLHFPCTNSIAYQFWSQGRQYLLVVGTHAELYRLTVNGASAVGFSLMFKNLGLDAPVHSTSIQYVPRGYHTYWRIGGDAFAFDHGEFRALTEPQVAMREYAWENRNVWEDVPDWECEPDNEDGHICPICWEGEQRVWKLPGCGHTKHAICVDCFGQLRNYHCPVCRQ